LAFLLKDTQPDDLVAAIRTIAAGDAVLAPGATQRLIRQFATTQRPEPPSGARAAQIRQALTAREQDVFSLIAAGMSNSEIAASLHVSEGTVKIHVGRILAKLDLRDRVQAVVLAYESALIRRTDPGSRAEVAAISGCQPVTGSSGPVPPAGWSCRWLPRPWW